MESLDSPYLEAIQRIEGSTPGEKYKVLNEAAAAVVYLKARNPEIDPILELKSSSNVPDLLIPLVHAEVSKRLKNPEGIIEALKSEDTIVFERALTAKWFFDGTNPDITNVKYYGNYIFPHVSLNNRIKLVKKLALSLCTPSGDKSTIADDFYIELSRKYGRKLAEPLLIACSELLIRKLIIEERKIALNVRLVKTIYKKYPNVILEYLKLSKSSDEARNLVEVNIFDYRDFLPQLLKKNINSFIELIEMHGSSLGIKFSRTRTELFMKQGIDAIIRSPGLFLPMMPMKVTAKLNKSQFRLMFRNLFPKKIEEFRFKNIFGYLEYCQKDKVELLLSTFEEIYHVNLLDCDERVTPELLKVLPVEERVEQARKKLKKDQDWHLGGSWGLEKSWRCYLTTDESIPLIKNQISKSSEVDDRRDLLQQMIYTCSVNNDQNALLETLKYISTRHKNEQGWMLLEVLERILKDFQVESLSHEHWKVLNDLMQLLHMKNEFESRAGVAQNLIIAQIHFYLINNLSIDERINWLIEINSKTWNRQWNILQELPDYEKKCLETFLRIIGKKYPENHKIWNDSWTDISTSLLQSLYDFNTRNSKNSKSKLENFSLRNDPWLLKSVKKILNDAKEIEWKRNKLAQILKDGEKDVYDELVPEDPEDSEINFRSHEILGLLKKTPEKVRENWEKYLKGLKEHIDERLAQRFVKSCRWHQELPIKFAKKSVSTLLNEKESDSLVVLALLYEGASFERVIAPLKPKSPDLDPKDDDSKTDYNLTYTIPKSLNLVTPPVSLDLILDFCVGDYIHTTVNCLTNVGRRVPVDKVIPFTMKLMEKPVSIKKHGLRLFIRVASIDEMKVMLTNLLRNEKHRSIRAIVFDNILQLFTDEPNEDTWAIMREAIEDLKPDDDVIPSMTNINKIPDEFIADYVRLFINAIRKLESMEDGLERKEALSLFSQLITSAIKVSHLFPEELHELIVDKHFADLSNPDYAFLPVLREYVVDGYLKKAGEKLEERLEHFSGSLKGIIEQYWNKKSEGTPIFLLANHMVYVLVKEVVDQSQLDTPIMKSIMESLFKTIFSVLKPVYAAESYLKLTYASLFGSTLSSKEFAEKIVEVLPTLIEVFSYKSLYHFANFLHEFLDKRITWNEWKHTELDVVESLIEFENETSTILASMLLFYSSKITDETQFWRIVKILRKHPHRAVVVYVNICTNQLRPESYVVREQ